MEAYAAAKARIFGQRALRVLNRDDRGGVRIVAPGCCGGGEKVCPLAYSRLPWSAFGSDLPSRVGDFGIDAVHGVAWLVRAVETKSAMRAGRRRAAADDAGHSPCNGCCRPTRCASVGGTTH